MNPIYYLKCLVGRHTPERELIHYDGLDYRSRCRGCDKSIRRVRPQQWRRSEGEAEAPAAIQQ